MSTPGPNPEERVTSPPPDPHALAAVLAELERIRLAGQRLLLAPLLAPEPAPEGLDPASAELLAVLVRLRGLLVASPAAGQALHAFLVAEGRRYAQTDQGAAWLAALVADPRVAELRNLFEVTTLNLLDGDPSTTVSTTWSHLLADALAAGELDVLLGRLVGGDAA